MGHGRSWLMAEGGSEIQQWQFHPQQWRMKRTTCGRNWRLRLPPVAQDRAGTPLLVE